MNVDKGMDIMKKYMEEEDLETTIKEFQEDLTLEDKIEFINVVEKMLFFGPTNSMKKFVRVILDQMEDLDTNIRCRILEQVYEADDPGYVERVRKWIGNDDLEVACRVYWLKQISYYPLYEEENQIEDWISMVFLRVPDPFHRNKIVMDAFRTYEENERFAIFVAVMRQYKKIFDDPVMYRVTFAHNIIKKELEDNTFIGECLDELIKIMNDPNYSFENQADICDFFLNTETTHITETHHQQAQRKMEELFRENMVSDLSIFANRQNVHSESIESSSDEVLKKLHEKYGLMPSTLEKLQEWRLEMEEWDIYKEQPVCIQHKVTLCMNRIFFDKRLYGTTKDTLVTIFGLVWRHIHHSEHEDELKKRLIEEMTEASGQCSTGIAFRLVNTLSGYDDFMLKISYREAILSKVMHHMNKKVMEHPDPHIQETLLYEMILPPSEYTSRKNFLEFFRKNIAVIKEELYEEYQEFVSDTDFDLYLKQALIVYEGQG
jgi:hypothetical protein